MNAVRLFYQSLVTPEEKAAYMAATRMSREDRMEYLAHVFGDKATEQVIREFAQATRTDLISIAEEAVRQAAQETKRGILASIAYFFSFKWLK